MLRNKNAVRNNAVCVCATKVKLRFKCEVCEVCEACEMYVRCMLRNTMSLVNGADSVSR